MRIIKLESEKARLCVKTIQDAELLKWGGGGKVAIATLLAAILFGGNAFATTYEVGTGHDYATLEALRQAPGIPAGGDTVTIFNDDSTISPTAGDTGLSLAVSGTTGTLLIGSNDATQRIIGSGRTGTNTGRFLTLTGGAATALTLELKNLTLDGFRFGVGGAINSATVLDIKGDSLVFSNNQATTYGAAIYSTQTLTLSGTASKFISNYSTGNGGAVFHNVGILTIAESLGANGLQTTFEGNRTGWNFGTNAMTGNGQGGAVATSGIGLVIGGAGVQFKDNWAGSQGGAVLMNGAITFNADTIGSSGSLFQGNLAGSQGGAIYSLSGNNFKIENAGLITFKDNKAGVANFDTQTMKGTTGTGYADSGGALFSFIGVAHKDSATLAVTDRTVIFDGNQAARYGGAVFSQGKMTMAGTASQFINNKAGLDGGAIYNATDALVFDGKLADDGARTTLQGNMAGWNFATDTMGTTGSGGAIYAAEGGIGGAGNYNPGSLTLGGNGLIFDKNQAAEYGGAVYSYGALNFNATVASGTNPHSEFTANVAGKDGGAIYNMTGDLTIANLGELIFSDNIAGWDYTTGAMRAATDTVGFGGALYSMDNVIITDRTAIFDGNATAVDGGAVFSQAMMTMQGTASQFTGNIAGRHGGAIYNATGTLLFDGKVSGDGKKTTLSGNVAGWDFATGAMGTVGSGGAIYSMDKISFLGSGSIFEENIVAEYGGAIFSDNDLDFSAINDAHSEFNRNMAGKDGGAIYNESGNIDIINTGELIFSGNIAGWDYTTGEMRVATDTVGFGGALYSKAAINIDQRNIVFDGNMAAVSGGAVAATTGFGISGSANITFRNNSAGALGGAIWSNGTVNIDGVTTFTNNEAGGHGGAIAMDGATAVLNVNALNFDQSFVGNSDSTGLNDIFLVNGATANFDVASGYRTFLAGGITDQFNAAVGGNQQSLTKNGLGTLTFGAGSTGYLHGDVNINAGTLRLENGASFGYDKVNNVNVGNVNIADGVTISYQFGVNGFDHSWIQGDTITIGDDTKFDLDGVIWQPDVRVIYNLAEARFDENGGTIDVTLNLDRGSFMTNEDVADRSGQINPNVSGWFFRDFTYYVDDEGNINKSFVNGIHTGNIYAVELFRTDEVLGVDPPYVDPSLKNRILSRRLDRCCKPIFCCSTTCDTGCDDESITCQGEGIYSSCFTAPTCPQWNAWIEGYGTGGSVGNYNGRNGFDYSTGGMLVGIEKETPSNHRLGFYYGYGSSWTTGRSISYNGRSENTFGGYLRIADELGYTLLMGNLGHNSYRSNRFIGTGAGRETFAANFGANTSGAYLERGFERRIASHSCLTPFAALQYSQLSTDWYDETPTAGSDLRLAQTAKLGYESLRTLVGARTQTMLRNRLNWNNSIHWEHELTKEGAVVRDEYLTSNATLNARTVGNYGGRDWVVYGTGLEFAVTPNMSLNAGYDLSFNKHSTFHTGMGGMTYTF